MNETASPTISILGCGWLGKPLAVSLIRSGYRARGSTTRPANIAVLKSLGIEPFLLDFSRQAQSPDAGVFFDSDTAIVSIPAGRYPDGEPYLLQMQEIIKRIASGSVTGVIFLSSTSVYRGINGHLTEEDADPAALLTRVEQFFRAENRFATTVLRFGGLVGPGRHPGRFLSGKKVTGGDDPVNLVHQLDCIEVIHALLARGIRDAVYNICCDEHPARKAFYCKVSDELNADLPIFVEPASGDYRIVMNEKVKRDLGYRFRFPDPMTMTF